MADPYGSVALFREADDILALPTGVDQAVSEYPDATLEGWRDNFAQPEIDSVLGGVFTVPFTTEDKTIMMLAAKLVVVKAYEHHVSENSGSSPTRAEKLRAEVAEKLEQIRIGKAYISHTRLVASILTPTDTQLEQRPDRETYVTPDSSEWDYPYEVHESDA